MVNENEFFLIMTALGMANIKIMNVEINRKGDMIVTVKSTEEGTCCHQCGRKIHKSCGHGQEVVLRHLPIFSSEMLHTHYSRKIRMPLLQG